MSASRVIATLPLASIRPASQADAKVPRSFLKDVFAVMTATPQHIYSVLTKRPARARKVAGSYLKRSAREPPQRTDS